MATQVVPFKDAQLPAHIQKALGQYKNIDERINVDQLSFRGKVWRTVIDGTEKALVNKDDEPVSTVHVVVVNANKAKSRSFYEGAFEEGKSKPPACWSLDGDHPDASVKEPVSSSCAKCPNAVKGSKITPQGKEVMACSTYKRLVVVPLLDLTTEGVDPPRPMLLRVPQTSMWDKNNEENEAKGYYAWDQFVDMLRKQGAMHTGLVAVKIRFDSRMAYPKLLFAASRWLEQEEIDVVAPLYESKATMAMLQASEAAAAVRKPAAPADDDADDDDAPEVAVTKKPAAPVEDDEPAPAPKKVKKAAPPPEDDEEEAPPPPKKKAAPPPEDDEEEAPAPKKVKKAAPVEEEEEEAPAPKKVKKAAPPPEDDEEEAPKKPAKAAKGLSDLSDLIEEFDDK